MLKIAIYDNDVNFMRSMISILKHCLVEYEVDYKIDMFESERELIDPVFIMMNYEVVLLNVGGEENNGIEVAKKLRSFSNNIIIVLLAEDMKYVLEGYRISAIRYFLKHDVTFEIGLRESVGEVLLKLNYISPKICVSFVEGMKKFELNRLIYIESNLHKLKYYIWDKDVKIYSLYNTLKNVETELKTFGFLRIHQSFLVNMHFIHFIEKKEVVLYNGIRLKISKSRYESVRKNFELFMEKK